MCGLIGDLAARARALDRTAVLAATSWNCGNSPNGTGFTGFQDASKADQGDDHFFQTEGVILERENETDEDVNALEEHVAASVALVAQVVDCSRLLRLGCSVLTHFVQVCPIQQED